MRYWKDPATGKSVLVAHEVIDARGCVVHRDIKYLDPRQFRRDK